MDYLWYSRKQAHHNSGREKEMACDDDLSHVSSFGRVARPVNRRPDGSPHKAYGDIVFYLDDIGEPHIVSTVSHNPDHGCGWDDIRLVTTAEKASFMGGTKRGINAQGRDFCAAKGIDATVDGIVKYIEMREHCALARPLTVGRTLKLGKKQR